MSHRDHRHWHRHPSVCICSALGFQDNEPATCSSPRLSYNFDANVQNALRATGYDPNAISQGLTTVLVLHPISAYACSLGCICLRSLTLLSITACGFAFFFLLTTLYTLARRDVALKRGLSCCFIFVGLLTAISSTVIFLVDVILVAVVRSRIKKDTDGVVSLGWGNGVWMALGATIALWLALVSATLGVLRGRRHR